MLAIMPIFSFDKFIFGVDLVNFKLMVEYEEWGSIGYKKGKMFFKVGVVNIVVFPYLATDK